jgi:alginate O-acetyltransferase complex protein AlgI
MLFNSIGFVIFFPFVVTVYFLLPLRFRRYFLLAASCYFYMSFIPSYMIILLYTTLVDYGGARLIEFFESKNRPGLKKVSFITALCLNIGLLIIFKYLGMLGDMVNVFGRTFNLGTVAVPDIILPIGISFHTFQSMGYLIDVYMKRQPAEHDFFQFSLFLMYFPQLVAGPIERGPNLFAQLKKEHKLKHENIAAGVPHMLWGMFKKVVVADNLSIVADRVFGDVESFGGLMLIAGILCFAFQIYCDFSGYSDIAIGAAKVMDIELMKNFDTPYFSGSVSEFWRRWHISLSTWFRDYVYIPMGGNRVSTPRWCLNQIVTFGISGIWHGANLTFAVWGLLNGLYIILARMLKPVREFFKKLTHIDKAPAVSSLLSILFTFTLISFSWIFFRAENFTDAFYVTGKIFGKTFGDLLGISEFRLYICKFVPFALLATELCMTTPKIKGLFQRSQTLRLAVYTLCLCSIVLFGAYDNKAFIYFQF